MAAQYAPKGDVDNELLMRLQELRTAIAARKRTPAYYIFPDKTLIEMASKLPTTMEEIESIYGVGKTKLNQYGADFLNEILRYINEKEFGIEADSEDLELPRRGNSGVNDMEIMIPPVAFAPIEIENFNEIRQKLDYYLEFYRNAAYTPENLQQAQADRTNLNRLKKALTTKRKEIKDICLEPYREIEGQFNELLSMIDAPLSSIAEFTVEMEQVRKDEKCMKIKMFFDRAALDLGSIADDIFSKDWFYNKKWENKGYKDYQWQNEIHEKISDIARDIQTIKDESGPHAAAVIAKYIETGSLKEASRYLEIVATIAEEETAPPVPAVQEPPEELPFTDVAEPVSELESTVGEDVSPTDNAPSEIPSGTTVVPPTPASSPADSTDDAQEKEYVFRLRMNKKQFQLTTIFLELNNIHYENIT